MAKKIMAVVEDNSHNVGSLSGVDNVVDQSREVEINYRDGDS
jgi:hypothetical protein